MSALSCPFWCVVHRDGVSLAERPHEGRPTTLVGLEGGELQVCLLQEDRRRPARLEVTIDGQAIVLPLDAAQTIMQTLRELHGVAQRAGATA